MTFRWSPTNGMYGRGLVCFEFFSHVLGLLCLFVFAALSCLLCCWLANPSSSGRDWALFWVSFPWTLSSSFPLVLPDPRWPPVFPSTSLSLSLVVSFDPQRTGENEIAFASPALTTLKHLAHRYCHFTRSTPKTAYTLCVCVCRVVLKHCEDMGEIYIRALMFPNICYHTRGCT